MLVLDTCRPPLWCQILLASLLLTHSSVPIEAGGIVSSRKMEDPAEEDSDPDCLSEINDVSKLIQDLHEHKLRHLKSIDLDPAFGAPRVGLAGAKAIAQGCPNLTHLYMHQHDIGPEGAMAIAEGCPHLTYLNVACNKVGSEGAVVIGQRLHKLTKLSIFDNQINDEGAIALAQGLPSLTELYIGINQVGDDGATALERGLPRLAGLSIPLNQIGPTGAAALTQGLPSLTHLDISHNQIGNDGSAALTQGLPNLTSLSVEGNDIGNEGIMALSRGKPGLTSLRLSDNPITDECLAAILPHTPLLENIGIFYSTTHDARRKILLTAQLIGKIRFVDKNCQFFIAMHQHPMLALLKDIYQNTTEDVAAESAVAALPAEGHDALEPLPHLVLRAFVAEETRIGQWKFKTWLTHQRAFEGDHLPTMAFALLHEQLLPDGELPPPTGRALDETLPDLTPLIPFLQQRLDDLKAECLQWASSHRAGEA